MNLKGEKMLMGFEYDFAKQGGAVGTIALPQFAGNELEGAKIIKVYAVAEELASAGTPTLTFGIAADTDKYLADCWTELEGAGIEASADLLLAATAADIPVMEIGTAALTAGKIKFYVEILA